MSELFNSIKTLAVKLTAQGERAVKADHPWIFDQAIEKISGEPKSGDKAIIFDRKKNKFLGLGLYDPDSPMRIKLLLPRQKMNLDRAWFLQKFKTCLQVRAELLKTDTNSFRWIFGENDGLPSLIVDVYADAVVIKLYSKIWLPYFELITSVIQELYSCTTIVLRLSRQVKLALKDDKFFQEGAIIFGQLTNEVVVFKEHGVKFSANIIHGHKTGYFLDHRENRRLVGQLSKGKFVMDIFSYAGGFSVHALVGGATKVVSVDISRPALETAQFNASLNGKFPQHEIRVGDAFEIMLKAINQREKFDIVIVDPPSFAKSKKDIPAAENAYTRLAKLSVKLVAPNGILVLASCSSRISADAFFAINDRALQSSRFKFQRINTTFHDIDHPINFPEGAYLKCAYYRIK